MADEKKHDENKPKGVKPAMPPGAKPAMPPGAKPVSGPKGVKPAMPPGTKPAMPPGAKPAAGPKGVKPAMPPGMKKAEGPKGARPDVPQPAGKRKPGDPPGAVAGTRPPVIPTGAPASEVKKPTLPPAGGDGAPAVLSRKDFSSDQDVRWCPGCGDYAILATVQRLMPELGVPRENLVFISGIGCSSRFPYYMETYGLHSIHGRAPTLATGLKASRPELDVWIITGDGDGLSIGGNHLIHILRRNVDCQILLFNNQIYGLTKGQYSPTSEQGKVTKSTPYGSIDYPFNPVPLAIGASGAFVARTMDRDPKHMKEILRRAHAHHGASFVEIYQNCNIFNDGAFFEFTEKDSKPERTLFLEHGKPAVFENGKKGVVLQGWKLKVVDLEKGHWSVSDCLVHDETSRELAGILSRIHREADLPQPFGVFYREERATYEDLLHTQLEGITEQRGEGDLHALLHAGDTWTIE